MCQGTKPMAMDLYKVSCGRCRVHSGRRLPVASTASRKTQLDGCFERSDKLESDQPLRYGRAKGRSITRGGFGVRGDELQGQVVHCCRAALHRGVALRWIAEYRFALLGKNRWLKENCER